VMNYCLWSAAQDILFKHLYWFRLLVKYYTYTP
jgi:hypothetical protein